MIRVDTLSELFDTALLLAYQPLPAGPPGRRGRQLHRAGRAGQRRAAGRGAGAGRPPRSTSAPTPRPSSSPPRSGGRRAPRAAGRRTRLIAVFVPPVATPGGAAYARGRCATAGLAGCRASRSPRCSWPPRACRPSSPSRAPTAARAAAPCPATPARSGPPPRWPGCAATRAGGPAGRRVRQPDRHRPRAGPRRWSPSSAPRARTRSPTTRPLELLACYGIPVTEFRLVAGVDAARGRGRGAGLPGRGQGGRGPLAAPQPTWSGCGWTSSPRPGSAGRTPS